MNAPVDEDGQAPFTLLRRTMSPVGAPVVDVGTGFTHERLTAPVAAVYEEFRFVTDPGVKPGTKTETEAPAPFAELTVITTPPGDAQQHTSSGPAAHRLSQRRPVHRHRRSPWNRMGPLSVRRVDFDGEIEWTARSVARSIHDRSSHRVSRRRVHAFLDLNALGRQEAWEKPAGGVGDPHPADRSFTE